MKMFFSRRRRPRVFPGPKFQFKTALRRVLWLILLTSTLLGFQNCGGFKAISVDDTGVGSAGLPSSSNGAPTTTTAPPPAGSPSIAEACGANYSPGHYALRRLTNSEYSYTVQDLLFTKQSPGAMMAGTLAGASGFSNDSVALTVSSSLLLGYYQAAEALATEVLNSKGLSGGGYANLVTCTPTQANCALNTVAALAKRAFRRPPTAAELATNGGLMEVFNASGNFDQGLHDVIVSVLMNPHFLTIPVVHSQSLIPTAVFALDNYQLATRLSYMLWQSMPDATLMAAADAGTLNTPGVLRAQIQRMLASPKASHMKDTLRDEYAGLSALAKTDFTVEGQSNKLRDSMIGETDAFFMDLIANNRSPLTVLNGQRSFVNSNLAAFYGLSLPAGADPNAFTAVQSNRIGLGSQASVLANTSGGDPNFTNPIRRGHWLIQQLYCKSPPPPPPGIPPLPAAATTEASIRERIAAHVSSPACIACHTAMDNFGLGAENYDAFGRTRTVYPNGKSVDASGVFPSGVAFSDSQDMFKKLSGEADALTCFPKQVMSYALSRAMTSADLCVASTVGKISMTPSAKFSDLLFAIATSNQFLLQTGEAP
jgi:hypothetical protein